MVLTYPRSRLQILRQQLINQQWRKLSSLLLLTKRARARAKSLPLLIPLHLLRTYLLLLWWCQECLFHLHQPRQLPLSPPPQKWPPNPRCPSRLLSPLPKQYAVKTPSLLQDMLWSLLTQSIRAFFVSMICFLTFLWKRSQPCTNLALVLMPLQTGEVHFILVPQGHPR